MLNSLWLFLYVHVYLLIFFPGCYYMYTAKNEVHKSSSLEIYYQCGLQSTESNVLLELTCQVIGDPCFNVLRTQEQLGEDFILFNKIQLKPPKGSI